MFRTPSQIRADRAALARYKAQRRADIAAAVLMAIPGSFALALFLAAVALADYKGLPF